MDLLCNAYSNTSDDEPEPASKHEPELRSIFSPPSKRPRPDYPYPQTKPHPLHRPNQQHSGLRTEASVAGRYMSKRERALLGPGIPAATDPKPDPSAVVAAAQAHLLASAGMDQSICIWNVWSRDQKLARVLNFHSAAVNDVKWSQQGLFVLSCGYDCSSRLVDVEKGIETQSFREELAVRVVKFHPENSNLFLSGGSKGLLRLWDIRTGKVAHEYIQSLGPILDVEFTINGKQFVSSSDVSGSNMSENSIVVWDVSREVYVEAYTCPCVRHHPFDPYFVAQSNGNYIAIFSSTPPFRLDKFKRYESHGVSGFPIKCSFSLDGEKLVSGSSDGSIYFYNCRSSELERKIKAYEQACIDVAFHPILPNIIGSCSWNGDVSVYE
ncbi:WD REPEATS REGION domain-containing protein [Citrus sinensis]|uniref:WD REPEATS REGION domain-containing protein n=1 Tax=Citrus sinensis TaxID=2711 RepID=A0ACB8NZD8_CITSI|nr:WD REPEATS REGION domain-containing protein [Citrus sinensis]